MLPRKIKNSNPLWLIRNTTNGEPRKPKIPRVDVWLWFKQHSAVKISASLIQNWEEGTSKPNSECLAELVRFIHSVSVSKVNVKELEQQWDEWFALLSGPNSKREENTHDTSKRKRTILARVSSAATLER